MLLQGKLEEFSLPNVLQLVKMSAKTGMLSMRHAGQQGTIYFREGFIYYATVTPQMVPIGERLVRAGRISPHQLEEALAAQSTATDTDRLGHVLVSMGYLDRGVLAEAIADQIEETAFYLLGWTQGDFEFTGNVMPPNEEIILTLSVEGVILEGCRRIDEWDLIMASLGSLQHIPRLEYPEDSTQNGVSFTPEQWRVVSLIDGRRDVGSVMRDCGLNRFQAATILRELVDRSLVGMRPAGIEGLGDNAVAVIVRSPIDFYMQVFLDTLNKETLTHHLLTVALDEEHVVEVPMMAVTMEEESDEGDDTLIFALGNGSSEPAWQQLASRCVAAVLLVNANSVDAVRASLPDLQAVREIADLPLVVAAYISVSEEPTSSKLIRRALGVGEDVPVIGCELRDPEAVREVVETALSMKVEQATT